MCPCELSDLFQMRRACSFQTLQMVVWPNLIWQSRLQGAHTVISQHINSVVSTTEQRRQYPSTALPTQAIYSLAQQITDNPKAHHKQGSQDLGTLKLLRFWLPCQTFSIPTVTTINACLCYVFLVCLVLFNPVLYYWSGSQAGSCRQCKREKEVCGIASSSSATPIPHCIYGHLKVCERPNPAIAEVPRISVKRGASWRAFWFPCP